jgi:hypothetical protein
MKKIIVISIIVFTFYSCASNEVGFDSVSKKEIMESWAWKIFIFTDEGEITPVGGDQNNYDSTIKVKSILAEDIWEFYPSDDLFFNTQKVAFKDVVVSANFTEIAMKKFSSYKNEKASDNYRDDNQILNTFSEETKRKK